MKTTIRGEIELSKEDIIEIMKLVDFDTIKQLLTSYIEKTHGYTPVDIVRSGDMYKAIIDTSINPTMHRKDENRGFTRLHKPKRLWSFLYEKIGEVLDEQRKRKKKFISFEDLLAELLDKEDKNGDKLFIKYGVPLPMDVLKQRLAQSQINRQSKTQPNLRGVTSVRDVRKKNTVIKEGGLKL